MVRWSASGDKR